MKLVRTKNGLLPFDELVITDIVTDGDNFRSITTQWHHNGELVKQDGHVIMLTGYELGSSTEPFA